MAAMDSPPAKMASSESEWKERCEEEYGISEITSPKGVTFHELYTEILYKYGGTIGVWQADVEPYGGLAKVQFKCDQIEGILLYPPPDPHADNGLQIWRIFTVELDENRKGTVLCQGGYGKAHPGELHQKEGETDVFSFKCNRPEMHMHSKGEETMFAEWLAFKLDKDFHDLDDEDFTAQFRKEFKITDQFETIAQYKRLQLPTPHPSAYEIIPPGIFKATYGIHGIELLLILYIDGHKKVEIRKLSGDENVPAGEVSITADLSRPMILSEDQQDSIETLGKIDPADTPEDKPIDGLPTQPFCLPSDCISYYEELPKTCMARFHTQSRVADEGFKNTRLIPGHLVVFDEDMFGHFCFELCWFNVYHRIETDVSSVIEFEAPKEEEPSD